MPEIRFNPILTSPVKPSTTNVLAQKTQKSAVAFSEVLSSELTGTDDVKFSKHAKTRLESRNIELDANDLKKLGGAVSEASQKGVQDSLVVMDGLAFIVHVKDRTVVTAMPVSEASSNVFTNIDGAVIA